MVQGCVIKYGKRRILIISRRIKKEEDYNRFINN